MGWGGGEAAVQKVGGCVPGGLGSLWFRGGSGELPPLCTPRKNLTCQRAGQRWWGGGRPAAPSTAGKLRQSHKGRGGGMRASWLGTRRCRGCGSDLGTVPAGAASVSPHAACVSCPPLPAPEREGSQPRGPRPRHRAGREQPPRLPADPPPHAVPGLPAEPSQAFQAGWAPAAPGDAGHAPPGRVGFSFLRAHQLHVPIPPAAPVPPRRWLVHIRLHTPLPLPAPFISSFSHSFPFLP